MAQNDLGQYGKRKKVNVFFGFMPNMGSFSPNMSPEDLRNLVIFPTFMIHLPKILDKAIQGIFLT